MNYGPLVFLAAFLALSASWFGFVLTPQIQIGRQQQETNSVDTAELYPQARPGMANQGLQIYRAEGCAACHSQQVGQTGTTVDVVLTEAGTNLTAVAKALSESGAEANATGLAGGLPKTVMHGVTIDAANAAVNALKTAGAKAEAHVVPVGPDIARGWGLRRSVASDYLFDNPAQPGSLRIGPDLANVGMRLPDANWHLEHLYAPKSVTKNSLMPPYRFLFETRKIVGAESPDALKNLPSEFAPPAGYEIVPKPEAKQLVAYLQSLRADAPLFEAPMYVAAPKPAATNAPAK